MVHQILAIDIGNIAYFIFLIVVAIINVVGKNRKKKKNTSPPGTPSPKRSQRDVPPTLEELIAKLSDSVEEPTGRPEITPEPEPIPEPKHEAPKPHYHNTTQPPKPKYTFTSKSEHQTSRGKAKNREATKSIAEEFEEDIAQGIEFDARKAIIYSEILRRPDF